MIIKNGEYVFKVIDNDQDHLVMTKSPNGVYAITGKPVMLTFEEARALATCLLYWCTKKGKASENNG